MLFAIIISTSTSTMIVQLEGPSQHSVLTTVYYINININSNSTTTVVLASTTAILLLATTTTSYY